MNSPVFGSIAAPVGAFEVENISVSSVSSSDAVTVKFKLVSSSVVLSPIESNSGESLIGLIVMLIVPMLLSSDPSFALKVKESISLDGQRMSANL